MTAADTEESTLATGGDGSRGRLGMLTRRSRRARRDAVAGVGSGAFLVCRGVDVAYDKVQVLFGVDLEVQEGEIIALLGTNGAGKSTLLKAVSGLVRPSAGEIFFDAKDITNADAVVTSKLGIIQVPGGKAVFPTLTVAEHFKASTWLYQREDPKEVGARTERVLQLFPRLRERWDQMAGNLSGGCLLYTSPSPRDLSTSRMPSSA